MEKGVRFLHVAGTECADMGSTWFVPGDVDNVQGSSCSCAQIAWHSISALYVRDMNLCARGHSSTIGCQLDYTP